MDRKSQKESKRIRIQREFECSRLEQAMLAEAYRKVLPCGGFKLVEEAESDHGDSRIQVIATENVDSAVSHSMATGGPTV